MATQVDTRRRRRMTSVPIHIYAVLFAISFIVVVPLLWMILSSLKADFQIISAPLSPLPEPFTIAAYQRLFTGPEPIAKWFWNSTVVAVAQTALILATASTAGYALARLEFWGKRLIFSAIIATLLVPPVILLIPHYVIIESFGWLDNLLAVIVPGAASAFGVFFLRQFFLGVPKEYEEAARMDGAGELRIFLQIVLPLAKPALATLAVLSFLGSWNEFLWPVYVLLSTENFTLQPGLSLLQSAYAVRYSLILAGAVIASLPVLIIFFFAQRQIIDGVANAGVKG
ncbi:carbohydrate ABC transporter permease [Cryobacterium lyxosi]|uniref:Carbohydrate ABC transporter permease n=1 Tax=Cryobacterium lyxosi TaxID=1259228 RepID=A0A4R8ZBV1_9MICO|nr:carbohydrate ABC transporter permease [Cryobacterium lyxosi]TFD23162.1 carbohydrate ABC transporter permease [Cryobacterium lyxosi]